MCDPVSLGVAAAATAAGDVISNNQVKASGRAYNAQVNAQNNLLQDQFKDRQGKIYNNQNTQNQYFDNMTADQNDAFKQLTDLANEKSGDVQSAVAGPGNVFTGTNSDEFNKAVANRQALTTQGNSAPTAYGASGATDLGARVLAALATGQQAKRDAVTGGVTKAQAEMGALSDTNQAQGTAFRNLDVNMGDVARNANNVSATLASKERLPQAQIDQINQANSNLSNLPYFRGPEPIYNPPNTAIASTLKGIGQLAAFKGAGGFGGTTGGGAGSAAATSGGYFNNPGAGLGA